MNNLAGDIKLSGQALGEVTIQATNADGSVRDLSDILADCRGAFTQLTESEQAQAAEALVGKNTMSGLLALMNAGNPASGSGNFLTETYVSIRRLENEAISARFGGQMTIGDVLNPIQVSIRQFHGIEINDFAVTVAKTALWIAESQMMQETENILYGKHLEFLTLKTNANIVEANALRIDWNEVITAEKLDYIMGNPPFVGARLMDASPKEDVNNIY